MKPTHLKAIQGSLDTAKGRRVNNAEPKGIGRPVPPAHLTPEQRERWDDIVGHLPALLLSGADVQVIERMAVAWDTYRQATAKIVATGLLTRGKEGQAIRNPLLTVRKMAAEEMDRAGMQLGLSPAGRARLTDPGQGEGDNPLAALLGNSRTA